MTNRLLVLIGEFDSSDREVANLLEIWSNAGLFNVVSWVSIEGNRGSRPTVMLSENSQIKRVELFELLTSRIWSQVNVAAIRQSRINALSQGRFDRETEMLEMIEKSFEAYRDLDINSYTCSIADEVGLSEEGFSNLWQLHLLQEPVARIDEMVAAQPLWDDERHLLITLLAVLSGGGFVWQHSGLVSGLSDPVSGVHRPLRVGRAYLRVVSAGRLTDEILRGAFPISGPWTIPPDVPNARAVPPGTPIADSVIAALMEHGEFKFSEWVSPQDIKPRKLGILTGVKLFIVEYIAALKGIPRSLVGRVKREIEEWVQRATFGSESSVLLSFDPKVDDLDSEQVVSAIRSLEIGAEIDPIGHSVPWSILQQASFSAVDGGRFPTEVPVPMQGSFRLVYTDPLAVGPSPEDEVFVVDDFVGELLNISVENRNIGPMDLEKSKSLQLRLEALRSEINRATKPSKKSKVESLPVQEEINHQDDLRNTQEPDHVKVRFWQFRKKRKLRRLVKDNEARQKLLETRAKDLSLTNDVGGDEVESNTNSGVVDVSGESERTPDNDAMVAESQLSRHKPSHKDFSPEEYVALTPFYQGEREELKNEYSEANKIYTAALTTYGTANGLWKLNMTCDHCGTAFDHGVLYLHEPTKELVHVGHICARKTLSLPDAADLINRKLLELDKRWTSWLGTRSGSLLWKVGQSIVKGLIDARTELSDAISQLVERPQVEQNVQQVQVRFKKWTRRGMFWFVLLIAASVASVVLTPLPLLLVALTMAISFSGFIIRLAFLARDLVKAQYKLSGLMDDYERRFARARHTVAEIVRLTSVREQFEDWQAVIREVVHVPFGRQLGFSVSQLGIGEVPRPPSMILGTSQPTDEQKMQLFLSARKQTIHAGWLTEIMDVSKEEWKKDYENARMTGPADNIIPESDNASSKSVVGKRPLSDEDVYYPRTDFRMKILSGVLQQKLVQRKSEQVAEDLRRTSVEDLLGAVEVSGLGSALNGMKVDDFLAGLSQVSEHRVAFPPELISDLHASKRVYYPETILPPQGTMNSEAAQLQVQPGTELTAAAWRIELSAPILPFEVFKAMVKKRLEDGEDEDDGDESSTVV